MTGMQKQQIKDNKTKQFRDINNQNKKKEDF